MTMPEETFDVFQGSLDIHERCRVLEAFRNGKTRILLINIKCGGQGLDL